MKNIIKLPILTVLAFIGVIGCQKKDPIFVDPNAAAPVIGIIESDKPALEYGDSIIYKVTVSDHGDLSHISVELVVNNSVLYTKTFPAGDKQEITVRDTIRMPFMPMSSNKKGELVVTAVNKNIKTSHKSSEILLVRPVFERLYMVAIDDNQSWELIKQGDDLSYTYSADTDFANGKQVLIYSKPNREGFCWGYSTETGAGEINSTTAITLVDSNNTELKVHKVTFDAMSFEVAPLKSEMNVNDVVFMPYKKSPSDGSFVSNVLRAKDVSVTKDGEVKTKLIDLDVITFDPDFFELSNGKLYYRGEATTVTLYLNRLFNFVFIESSENEVFTSKAYPEVMFVNGWGTARPEIWNYNPDWNFNSAPVLRKASEDSGKTVYTQTLIFSKWVQFKLYKGKDWGYEITPTDITLTGDDLMWVKEEDGKPGNFNIEFKCKNDSDVSAKLFLIKITVTIPKTAGTVTCNVEYVSQSDVD